MPNALEILLMIELGLLACLALAWAIARLTRRSKDKEGRVMISKPGWVEIYWQHMLKPVAFTAADGAGAQQVASRGIALETASGVKEIRAVGAGAAPSEGKIAGEALARGGGGSGGGGSSGTVTVTVVLTDNSPMDMITGYENGMISMTVTGSAQSGSTNQIVARTLADALGVAESKVVLIKGHYDPRKTLQISGVSANDLASKLG